MLSDVGFWNVINFRCCRCGAVEGERTLAMIKPDGLSGKYTEKIKAAILDSGFRIVKETEVQLDAERASLFYAEHSQRSFFDSLVKYITRYYCCLKHSWLLCVLHNALFFSLCCSFQSSRSSTLLLVFSSVVLNAGGRMLICTPLDTKPLAKLIFGSSLSKNQVAISEI